MRDRQTWKHRRSGKKTGETQLDQHNYAERDGECLRARLQSGRQRDFQNAQNETRQRTGLFNAVWDCARQTREIQENTRDIIWSGRTIECREILAQLILHQGGVSRRGARAPQ